MKPKQQIRKELYDYIESLVPLEDKNRKMIKRLVLEHDKSESANDIRATTRLNNLNNTLNKYIAKAKKLNSPKANLQAEGLEMCLNWLNQDDE